VDHDAWIDGRGLGVQDWRVGFPGKFLIDWSGKFYAWRTDVTGAPHHAVAAEMVSVSSWVIDGVIDPDGTWERTAQVPDADHGLLIERAMPQARALGLRRFV
jgi:hypothetical protein